MALHHVVLTRYRQEQIGWKILLAGSLEESDEYCPIATRVSSSACIGGQEEQ